MSSSKGFFLLFYSLTIFPMSLIGSSPFHARVPSVTLFLSPLTVTL